MKKHVVWMIIGCGLPLLLIFFAPALGITGNTSLFIFILAMFAFHLLMPMGHGGHKHGSHENQSETPKSKTHESHQH
jgi:hypothetical protein